LYLRGFPTAPIRNIELDHCTFENVSMPNVIENVRGLKLVDVKVDGKTLDSPTQNSWLQLGQRLRYAMRQS
jgi:hypothetical protein